MCLVVILVSLLIQSVSGHLDAEVLLDIKRHLYDPLDALRSWNDDAKSMVCRSWNGVVCDVRDRVVRIALPRQRLEGSITADFSQIEFLQELSLEGNRLHGTLPMLLENGHLEVIKLGDNQFDGPFLFSNPLSWTSPLSRSLRELHLENNQLSGGIGGGPSSYFRHSVLERLNLGNNNLTGPLPPGFEGLYCLRYLNLVDNVYLEGPVPSRWSYFRHLYTLSVINDRCICGGREYIEHIHELNLTNSGLENGCNKWEQPSPSPSPETPSPSSSPMPSPSPETPSPSSSPMPSPSPETPSPSSSPTPSLVPSPTSSPPSDDKPKIPIVPIIPIIPIIPDFDDDDDGDNKDGNKEDPSPRNDLPNETDVPGIAPQPTPENQIPVSTTSPEISPSPSPGLTPSPSPSSSLPNRTMPVTPFRQPDPIEDNSGSLPVKIRKLDTKVVTPLAAGVLFIAGLSTLAYFFLPTTPAGAIPSPSVFNMRTNPLAV